MNRGEILEVLKVGANFQFDKDGYGYGAINLCPECEGMSLWEYKYEHYPKMAELLESLDWNVVENPRLPKDNEYPTEEGEYLTMLDCDEHSIFINRFREGHWTLYNKTHIKWWMKLPEE